MCEIKSPFFLIFDIPYKRIEALNIPHSLQVSAQNDFTFVSLFSREKIVAHFFASSESPKAPSNVELHFFASSLQFVLSFLNFSFLVSINGNKSSHEPVWTRSRSSSSSVNVEIVH